jgi:hypothetical protein
MGQNEWASLIRNSLHGLVGKDNDERRIEVFGSYPHAILLDQASPGFDQMKTKT